MKWRETPTAARAWIGRHGTRAVALTEFAGLGLPWLAAIGLHAEAHLLKPVLARFKE
jgi:hypothetical protein